MIASAVIGGLIAGVLPTWFGWGLIIREIWSALSPSISLSCGAPWRCDSGQGGDVRSIWAVPAFYLAAAGAAEWLLWPVAWILGIIGLVLYWYVAFLYIGTVERNSRR